MTNLRIMQRLDLVNVLEVTAINYTFCALFYGQYMVQCRNLVYHTLGHKRSSRIMKLSQLVNLNLGPCQILDIWFFIK